MAINSKLSMKSKKFLSVKDITFIGLAVAMIEAAKIAMASIPNVELTSFLLIIFTLILGKKILLAVPVFILIEGAMYGFGIWWFMYAYTWPILAIVALIFRKMNSATMWAVVSGIFGLLFGFSCSLSYIFVGGIKMAFSWWIVGIPWDIIHGVSNFIIMFVLYHPVMKVVKVLKLRENVM